MRVSWKTSLSVHWLSTTSSEIQPHHLPTDLKKSPELYQPDFQTADPNKSLEENDREYILSVLTNVEGNKTKAAKIIGIDRMSLSRKLKRYEQNGIDVG